MNNQELAFLPTINWTDANKAIIEKTAKKPYSSKSLIEFILVCLKNHMSIGEIQGILGNDLGLILFDMEQLKLLVTTVLNVKLDEKGVMI